MVAAFLLSTVGLGPVYEPDNPLDLSAGSLAWFRGFIEPELRIDLEQIRQLTQHLPSSSAVNELCGMLVISAHAIALETVGGSNGVAKSPTLEFFRHIRNAAAHGNRFTFGPREPKWPAKWRGLILDRVTHANVQCFGKLLNPADALALLGDVQDELSLHREVSG